MFKGGRQLRLPLSQITNKQTSSFMEITNQLFSPHRSLPKEYALWIYALKIKTDVWVKYWGTGQCFISPEISEFWSLGFSNCKWGFYFVPGIFTPCQVAAARWEMALDTVISCSALLLPGRCSHTHSHCSLDSHCAYPEMKYNGQHEWALLLNHRFRPLRAWLQNKKVPAC